MVAPIFAPFPAAPSRAEGRDDFSPSADTFAAALPPFAFKMNLAISWIGEQVTAAEGYKNTASDAATVASDSADAAAQSKTAAQAAAIAAGNSAGLPSLAGNARRALAVLPNEAGVSWLSQIKALYIEPLLKANVTGAYALNVGVSGFFNLTLTGNTVISVTGLPTLSATEVLVVALNVNQGATAFGLTFPASWIWRSSGGLPPAAPAAGKSAEYLLTFEGSQVFARKGAGT
jgi:hypothetical protein